jgi:diaminopimelate epimerase
MLRSSSIMRIEFTKMAGAGNDFIFLGPEYARLKAVAPDLARRLCARRTSVGADGLVIVERSEGLVMHYYNGDGSEASFCGNGARCLVLFCETKNIAHGKMEFRTGSGSHTGEVTGDRVRVSVGQVRLLKEFSLDLDGSVYDIALAEAGVPHAVIMTEHLDDTDVEKAGRRIRSEPAFGRAGANVDFVEARAPGEFGIRTYERGVERETLACGSGCVAAAYVLHSRGIAGEVVGFHVRSGDYLNVELPHSEDEEAYLAGPARIVFDGSLELNL